MKFKVFNQENSPHEKVRNGQMNLNIRFCRSGAIILSRDLLKHAGLGGGLIFIEDEDYPGDFYVAACNQKQAFIPERKDKRGSSAVMSSTLVSTVAAAVKMPAPFLIEVEEKSQAISGFTAYALRVKQARSCARKDSKQ